MWLLPYDTNYKLMNIYRDIRMKPYAPIYITYCIYKLIVYQTHSMTIHNQLAFVLGKEYFSPDYVCFYDQQQKKSSKDA